MWVDSQRYFSNERENNTRRDIKRKMSSDEFADFWGPEKRARDSDDPFGIFGAPTEKQETAGKVEETLSFSSDDLAHFFDVSADNNNWSGEVSKPWFPREEILRKTGKMEKPEWLEPSSAGQESRWKRKVDELSQDFQAQEFTKKRKNRKDSGKIVDRLFKRKWTETGQTAPRKSHANERGAPRIEILDEETGENLYDRFENNSLRWRFWSSQSDSEKDALVNMMTKLSPPCAQPPALGAPPSEDVDVLPRIEIIEDDDEEPKLWIVPFVAKPGEEEHVPMDWEYMQ